MPSSFALLLRAMTESFTQEKTLLTLQAHADCGNERIDRFLAKAFHDDQKPMSRSRIKSLILDHQLSENGSTLSDPSAPVKSGATYILTLLPPVDATPKGEDLPLDILFEDDHIIAINKPVGLVVHPAPGSPTGTLVNALIAHCGESLTGIGGMLRPGIVHRLDKDTSGVMIAAKTAVAHANLTSMFAAQSLLRKEFLDQILPFHAIPLLVGLFQCKILALHPSCHQTGSTSSWVGFSDAITSCAVTSINNGVSEIHPSSRTARSLPGDVFGSLCSGPRR